MTKDRGPFGDASRAREKHEISLGVHQPLAIPKVVVVQHPTREDQDTPYHAKKRKLQDTKGIADKEVGGQDL